MPTTTTNSLLVAFFDNLVSGITPTANFTPAAGHPISNLVDNRQLFARCRTPDLTTNRTLTWDFGVPIEVNTFGLFGTNATLSAVGELKGADDSGFTTNVVTYAYAFDATLGQRVQFIAPWGRSIVKILPESVSKRFWRWTQSDTTNPLGYQEWAIPGFGLGFQPQYGFETYKAMVEYVGSPGLEIPVRGHEFTISNLTKEDAYNLQSICLTSLSTRRMLVIPEALAEPTYLHDAIWAVMKSVYVREPVAVSGYSDKRFKVVLTFQEVSR